MSGRRSDRGGVVLPTPPERYDAREQAELRRAIEDAFQRLASRRDLITTPAYNIQNFGAQLDGDTDDTDALEEAIGKAPEGATIWTPTGTPRFTRQIVITKPLILAGEGLNSQWLFDGVSAGQSPILVQGSADFSVGFGMRDLSISPVTAGVGGTYAVELDVEAGYLAYQHYRNVLFGRFAGGSLKCTNGVALTPTRNDGLFVVGFHGCIFQGDIDLTNIGDTIVFDEETLVTGPGGFLIDQISSATDSAHGFTIRDCNITNSGGITVLAGNGLAIHDNNIENPANSTQANRVMIDLQGRSTRPLVNVKITNNELGGAFADGGGFFNAAVIRYDYCYGARTRDNKIGPPGGGYALDYTANSEANIEEGNTLHAVGLLLKDYRRDLGKSNLVRHWQSPSGSGNQRNVYDGHSTSTSNTIVHAAGKSQASTAPIHAVVAADYTAVTVTCTANAALAATSISVAALSGPIPRQTTLLFNGTQVATLRTDALAGAVTILVTALGNTVSNGQVATWNGLIDPNAQGYLRTFGSGNVRIGAGTDTGAPFQVEGFSSLGTGASALAGDFAVSGTGRYKGTDSAGTSVGIISLSSADNDVRVGTLDATATNGDILLTRRGVTKGTLNANGLGLVNGFGANGVGAQPAQVSGGTLVGVINGLVALGLFSS